ncbi:AtuA-related protein [Rhodococcoides kyotonense]|uniref:AtuA-like ferredoxin-fold domain-containing protein n=1 Tax=Rhodococcoides kyotonense TaxID=398843 RepID=A0A239FKK8_9NOCA|nr:hypothetical protein [Rhodococcus kyotonensis]SNS57108.1 hypothetical protein SAMN05421642_103329 [Rhodococcus kyotonensis]
MITVDDLADVRTGDKGDTLILAVIARDRRAYDHLVESLTLDRVVAHFGNRTTRSPRRTLQENLTAMVFELPGQLGGGVTGSAELDGHGKTLSYHLLGLAVSNGN